MQNTSGVYYVSSTFDNPSCSDSPTNVTTTSAYSTCFADGDDDDFVSTNYGGYSCQTLSEFENTVNETTNYAALYSYNSQDTCETDATNVLVAEYQFANMCKANDLAKTGYMWTCHNDTTMWEGFYENAFCHPPAFDPFDPYLSISETDCIVKYGEAESTKVVCG